MIKFLLIVLAPFITMNCMAQYELMGPQGPAMAVSIDYKNGLSGSGVFVNDSQYVYLVTAKHMIYRIDNSGHFLNILIDDTVNLTAFSYDLNHSNLIRLDLKGSASNNLIICDSVHDVIVIMVGKIEYEGSKVMVSYTRYVKKYFSSGINTQPINDIGQYNDVETGFDTFVYGYPKSIGLGQGEYDSTKPLLIKGVIAGKNEIKRTLILNAQVYHGNSGGPAYCFFPGLYKFKLVGIVTQLIPVASQIYQGGSLLPIDKVASINSSDFSVIVPIDQIFKIVNQEKLKLPSSN
jgi:hypothetical protein